MDQTLIHCVLVPVSEQIANPPLKMQLSKVATLLGVICLIAGCGGGAADRPKTVPVSGTVVYNGQPLEGATVSFWCEGAPRAATGLTDKDGKFKLSMFAFNDGAIPGVNKITVSKAEASGQAAGPSPEEMLRNPSALAQASQQRMQDKGGAAAKPLVPAKYGSQTSTPLKETVNENGSGNEFVIQLTD